MLPGPGELAFLKLYLCSQPPLNSLAHERCSQMKLSFPTPVVLRPCGCRNKVCDFMKVVTCFLSVLHGIYLLAALCGGWEGE